MKSILSILVLMVALNYANAVEKPAIQPESLNQQYNRLSSTCETIDGFRMMKLYKMDQFWKVVQDSLREQLVAINKVQTISKTKDVEITALKSFLISSKEQIAQLETSISSINILGSDFSKEGFVFFSTTTIISLFVLSSFLFIMTRSVYKSYKDEKNLHEAIFNEYENYKHAAIEKQMKLSRELQDYRNRSNEMKKSA